MLSSPGNYAHAGTDLGVTPEFLDSVRLMRVFRQHQIDTAKDDVRSFGQTRYTTDDSVSNPHNAQPMRVGKK